MSLQFGFNFPSVVGFTALPSSFAAPQAAAVSHNTVNSTNAVPSAPSTQSAPAVPQSASSTTGAGAAPGFFVSPFSASQGAAGFITPFGLVGGFGGGFGANFGSNFEANFAPSGGFAGAPAGAAELAVGGHQISNPTNSLAAPGGGVAQAPDGFASSFANPFANASIAAPSVAAPFLLSPSFVQVGAPVVLALPVFAVGFFAQPIAAAPVINPAPAPTDEPVPDSPPPVVEAETPVDAAPPAPPTTTPEPSSPPVVDVVPEPPVTITPLANADFASYQQEQVNSQLQTQLQLSLTTAEGDTISLDFSQLDVLRSNSLTGLDANDVDLDRSSDGEEFERLVNIDIQGDLSAAEQAAVDALLDDITSVAQSFFQGSLNDAVSQLRNLDFDTTQLSELSLQLSQTRTTQIQSGYREGLDQLDQLTSRGGEVLDVLDFFATEQRRLIDRAKEVFDDASAVNLVTSLIPPLLEDPAALSALAKLDANIEQLAEPVAEPNDESIDDDA